jgi:hypothetical protein
MIFKIKNFIKNIQAAVLVEFGLTFPLMVMMLLGMVEVSNLAYQTKKYYNLAYQIACMAAGSFDNTSTAMTSTGKTAGFFFDTIGIHQSFKVIIKEYDPSLTDSDYGSVLTVVQKSGSDVHIVYQSKYDTNSLVNTKFPHYTPPAPDTHIDQAFINANKITDLSTINNYQFVGDEQILVFESSVNHKPAIISELFAVPAQITLENNIEPLILRSNMFYFFWGGNAQL